jgi:hypothetical protein
MDISLTCKKAVSEFKDRYDMNISIEGADEGDILDHFSVKQIVDHFGADNLLKYIDGEKTRTK